MRRRAAGRQYRQQYGPRCRSSTCCPPRGSLGSPSPSSRSSGCSRIVEHTGFGEWHPSRRTAWGRSRYAYSCVSECRAFEPNCTRTSWWLPVVPIVSSLVYCTLRLNAITNPQGCKSVSGHICWWSLGCAKRCSWWLRRWWDRRERKTKGCCSTQCCAWEE